MSLVLMGLGPYRFSDPGLSYGQISRRFGYRWVPQFRVGSRPSQQFLGADEELINIHGVIYPHYTGGYGQLNSMRSAAEGGVPYGLASGRGLYYGPWCIRSIIDEQEYFHADGTPRRVEFDIELVSYGS